MFELKIALVAAIAVAVVVLIALLLIIMLIIFKVRERISKKVKPKVDFKTPGLATQLQESKPGVDSVLHAEPESTLSGELIAGNAEPQSKHSVEMQINEPVVDIEPSVAPLTNETVTPAPENEYKNLPQDSMLRRHYLTNLHAMIESLTSPRPTDSALSRHYDAMIMAEMEQCLGNEDKMERLVCNYEEHKKTLARQIQKPEAKAEPLTKAEIKYEMPKLPEDSVLRRHYLTHLRALVESRMPPRPTDATLRRHYDSMLENEVKSLL